MLGLSGDTGECGIEGSGVVRRVGSGVQALKVGDHVFDSRSPSFLQGVMAKTGNRGVDLVLNSLSSELTRASWKCVATFQKMLEL